MYTNTPRSRCREKLKVVRIIAIKTNPGSDVSALMILVVFVSVRDMSALPFCWNLEISLTFFVYLLSSSWPSSSSSSSSLLPPGEDPRLPLPLPRLPLRSSPRSPSRSLFVQGHHAVPCHAIPSHPIPSHRRQTGTTESVDRC